MTSFSPPTVMQMVFRQKEHKSPFGLTPKPLETTISQNNLFSITLFQHWQKLLIQFPSGGGKKLSTPVPTKQTHFPLQKLPNTFTLQIVHKNCASKFTFEFPHQSTQQNYFDK